MQTARSERLHIGIFGRCNAGKSTLINTILNQDMLITSPVAGTTTDPVYKAMELPGTGSVVFIDTAGIDDKSDLAKARTEKSSQAAEKTDLAVVLIRRTDDLSSERTLIHYFIQKNTPVIIAFNEENENGKADEKLLESLKSAFECAVVSINAKSGAGIDILLDNIRNLLKNTTDDAQITGNLVSSGDTVLLVMPQDGQAPKGRLILPQVQTIRELLDKGCIPVCVTPEKTDAALAAMLRPPKLIITDSQVFKQVYSKKPAESRLTSFSVLFAAYKGDAELFIKGADTIDSLNSLSRVLISEACSHKPTEEDIGRVKLPRMLRERAGKNLQIDFSTGGDFPADLSGYDLIIHCGACMFNKKYVLSRISRAVEASIPITNYGIAMAKLAGLLDKIVLP